MTSVSSPGMFISKPAIDNLRDNEVFEKAASLMYWALLPCGHKIFCETCIKLYMQETHSKSRFEDKKCPKCRQPIATTQRIYD